MVLPSMTVFVNDQKFEIKFKQPEVRFRVKFSDHTVRTIQRIEQESNPKVHLEELMDVFHEELPLYVIQYCDVVYDVTNDKLLKHRYDPSEEIEWLTGFRNLRELTPLSTETIRWFSPSSGLYYVPYIPVMTYKQGLGKIYTSAEVEMYVPWYEKMLNWFSRILDSVRLK